MKVHSVLCLLLVAVFVACQDLPTNFDTRQKWSNCVVPIMNQGSCGSCWSFSTSSAMTARMCIAGVLPSTTLSNTLAPQFLVNCVTGCNGCNGGSTSIAYQYIRSNGQDLIPCTAYVGRQSSCPSRCDNGGALKLYQGGGSTSLLSSDIATTVRKMQVELFNNGPLSVAYLVFDNFYNFFRNNPNGIFRKKDAVGVSKGGHAVTLIGWGEENGVKYWLIANSWDTTWANKGTFKIERGIDLCTIESRRVDAGNPRKGFFASNTTVVEENTPLDGAPVRHPVDEKIFRLATLAFNKISQNQAMTFLGVEDVYSQVVNGVVYHVRMNVQLANGNNESQTIKIHEDVNGNVNFLL